MSELDRRHIDEQLGGARDQLASMHEDLRLIREALRSAIREQITERAERHEPNSN